MTGISKGKRRHTRRDLRALPVATSSKKRVKHSGVKPSFHTETIDLSRDSLPFGHSQVEDSLGYKVHEESRNLQSETVPLSEGFTVSDESEEEQPLVYKRRKVHKNVSSTPTPVIEPSTPGAAVVSYIPEILSRRSVEQTIPDGRNVNDVRPKGRDVSLEGNSSKVPYQSTEVHTYASDMPTQGGDLPKNVSPGARDVSNVPTQGDEVPMNVSAGVRDVFVKKRRNTRTKLFTSLKTRSNPRMFVSAMSKLNKKQKACIIRIGFGAFLDMEITSLPLCLLYWLVDHFDANKCCLVMADGGRLDISDIDVHITLGLPMGKNLICRKGCKENVEVVKKWRSSYANADIISPSAVIDKMLADVDAGDQFLSSFMIVFHSLLLDSNQNGTANQSLVKVLAEIEDVREMNWCRFLLESLVDSKRIWEKNKSSHFRGPILFLVLFYMDRVKLYSSVKLRSVSRSFPVFHGLTSTLLRQRETDDIKSGGFGRGSIQSRQSLPTYQNNPVDDKPKSPLHAEPNDSRKEASPLEAWIQSFAEKTSILASAVSELANLTTNIPPEFKDDAKVKTMIEAANKLLGLDGGSGQHASDAAGKSHLDNSPKSTWNSSQLHFWSDPILLDCLTQFELAEKSKQRMKSHRFVSPSFNIFDSKTGASHILETVVDIAKQYAENAPVQKDANAAASMGTASEPVIPSSTFCKPSETQLVPGHSSPTQDVREACSALLLLPSKRKTKSLDPLPARRSTRFNPTVADTSEQGDVKENASNIPKIRADAGKGQGDGDLKRSHKPGVTLRSHYSKVVDINDQFSDTERIVSAYLARRSSSDTEVLFKYNGLEVVRHDMKCLEADSEVSPVVIDAWAALLNHKEQYKSVVSPSRLFLTAHSSHYIPNSTPKLFADQCDKFGLRIDAALSLAPHITLKDVELFVFGVQREEDFYMVAFNLNKEITQIMDVAPTISNPSGPSLFPSECLGDMLIEYLRKKGFLAKSKLIAVSKTSCHDIPWAGKEKKLRSAICTMRHMETFMGIEKGYKCGFEKVNVKNVSRLLLRYLTDLLFSEVNELRSEVLEAARAHANLSLKGVEGKKLKMGL